MKKVCVLKLFLKLVLLIRLINAQHANPLKDPLICGQPKCSSNNDNNNKFKYESGRFYTYSYSINAKTLFNNDGDSSSKNESTMLIDADVTLNFLTPCNGLLTISNVALSEFSSRENDHHDEEEEEENSTPVSMNSQLFAEMITETDLRFAFNDGIVYEICPQIREKNFPLNFKRGILSMIQNSMKRFDLDFNGLEDDVRGRCPTNYRIIGTEKTSLIIEKTKELDDCTDRIKLNSIIQMTTANMPSRTKNENILKSTSKCTLSIDGNIYNEIICKEEYLLEPFSNDNVAGALTTVIQKFVIKNQGDQKMNDIENNEISKRTNLKFDHAIPKQPTIGDLKSTRDLIKKLCKESLVDSESDFSDLFGKFIYGLRSLSYPALSSFYSHSAVTCPSAKKHILEALPYVNTAGSLELMKDLIIAGKIPENSLNDWMMNLAFIPNPDETIMQSVSIILKEKSLFSSNVALSVASITHTYCGLYSDCEKNDAVYSIIEYFENHLIKLLKIDKFNRQNQDEIILTLKALSTIGWISEKCEEELFKLVGDPNLDVGVRRAAIETFRRLSCEKHRSYFESIFEDQEQDTEVRIAAYLQVMRCPSYLLVRKIAFNLKNEEVNQVGSFVWTHLHNIIKSSNPLKVEIQSLLSEEDLIEKFNSDFRKFSHNREGSLYFDEYNFGGNYETNVLFSPSSYIPRAAMLNLTVDLFGKYVNLFEVDGRLEGFENYLESFFGPGGKANILKNTVDKFKTRWIRDTTTNKTSTTNKEENEFMENKVQEFADISKNGIKQEPKVAFGLKVFGNDLKYLTFKGDKEIQDAIEHFNILNHLKRMLSGKEIKYKKTTMFLDSNYVVASGAGLPLFLSALGTASVKIKLFGSLKAINFLKIKELDLVANIEPSAALGVSAEMSLSAFYGNTGIKLHTDMQSSVCVQGDLKIRGIKLMSVKFSLPKKNIRIFAARSELLVRQNNVEIPQRFLTKSTDVTNSLCSWSLLSDAIGLKFCFDYNYKNSSGISSILTGPAFLNIYVEKSDPTANIYLFEYKWIESTDLSVLSLTFDTPGSAIKRLIHGNFTTDKSGNNNLTLLAQSSAGIILAKGRLKNNEDQKVFKMTLDINDKKHFDASIAYDRFKKVNGYTYKPRLYLGVNGERVLELQGSIDLLSKKDISQYTVDLDFETKRFQSKLFGYISKKESSIGSDLHLDYKFLNSTEQRVSFKFGLANRSSKNLITVIGTCDIQSTAYENFNFYSNITYRRSGSHVEFKIGLIQNPLPLNDPQSDYESLKFDFIFSHKAFTDSKQTIKAIATIKRISTNLDLQSTLLYESINADINFECNANYGANKKVAIKGFWSHPRTTLEEIKAHLNVTIPTFTPMTLKVEIVENRNKNYRLDISGTFFSNHSATILGYYQDKSTTMASNHHLKTFIRSPNFRDIDADLVFYRDNEDLKIDIKSLYGIEEYQMYFNYMNPANNNNNNNNNSGEIHTNVKIKYNTKLYTLNTAVVRDGQHFKINTELHIDQLRDIEFSVWVFNEETQKALGFDINWDANRDPNQKLFVAANFTKAADFNYNADLIVSYPGRTIIGKYQFLLEKGHVDLLGSISWDDGKSFAINLNIKYKYENEIFFEISSRVNTPLDSFKNIKLAGVFEHFANKYNLNGALTWSPRQKIAINFFGDYSVKTISFDCKYSCSLESTLNNIPSVNVTLEHFQNNSDYNSTVHLMYNSTFRVDLDSKWKIQTDEKFSNITGTVITATSFASFKKGLFIGKGYYTIDKQLRGVAEIDIDHKKMLLDIEGRFKKLMDSMFIANITSPEETYQCQFKLSKKERHFIALITYPQGNLGTEVLFLLNDLVDFNVKVFLATPVEFLQRILIAAKLHPGEADFRIGWNSLLLGFSGLSHYVNIIDFQYRYKIYTPIKDFEDNGLVAKLIFKEGLDFEISFKLSQYKLGVKLVGKPKPKPLKELGVNIKNVYYSTSSISSSGHSNRENNDEDEEEEEEEEEEGEDFLSFKGLIEVDAIIYPTMKGQVEIDQKGPVYVIQSKIHLPHGLATIFDEIEFNDILSMQNTLRIVTPYKIFAKINSDFQLNFIESKHYRFNFEFSYQNSSRPVTTSILAEYNVNRERDVDDRIYNVTVEVNTPFKAFPKLKLFGAFETEENFYRTKLLFTTNRSDISLDGTAETDEGWIDVISDFHVTSPVIIIPQSQLRLNKLTSSTDNYVEVHLRVPDKLQSEVYFKSSWLFKTLSEFRCTLEVHTPFTGFENTKAGVDFLSTNLRTTLWTDIYLKPISVQLNSTMENDILNVNSLIQHNGKLHPVNINAKIIRLMSDTDENRRRRREFNGTLWLDDKVFKINGNANVIGNLPVKVLITFTPQDNTVMPLSFQYNLETTTTTTLQGYGLDGSLSYSNKLTHFSGNATIRDKFNWEFNLQIEPENPIQKVSVHAVGQSTENSVKIDVESFTNIPKLEHPTFGLNYRNHGILKTLYGHFTSTNLKANTDLAITWVYLENMLLNVIGSFENDKYNSSSQLEMHYKNPQKIFSELHTGGIIKIDKLWEAGANASLKLPDKNNVSLEGHLKIPNDFRETHSLFAKLIYGTGLKFIDFLGKYKSNHPLRQYGLWGEASLENKKNLSGIAVIEWNGDEFHNNGNFIRKENSFDLIYKLKTPKYVDKQTFIAEVTFNNDINDHYNITCNTYYPENIPLLYGTIDYVELANMLGMLNVSLPHKSLNFTGINFNFETNSNVYNRNIKFFWANDTALLNSKCNIKTDDNNGVEKLYKGKLLVEFPLATRHVGVVDYEYDKKVELSTGRATVEYNGGNVLESKYNCLSKSEADEELDKIHIELLNKIIPIGADYVHRHKRNSFNMPRKSAFNLTTSVDNKQLHLYHLQNRTKFNLTGEINVETHQDGQLYVVSATHLNRTVILSADYSIQSRVYKQHSKLQLSPKIWMEYDFTLRNKTIDNNSEVEEFLINISYPRRNFSGQASYNITETVILSDILLEWDKDKESKYVEAALDWQQIALHRKEIKLLFKHPSFEKDVSILTNYGYENSSLNGHMVIDYSTDPQQTVTLGIRTEDKSKEKAFNYSYNIWAEHCATELYLNCLGHVHWSPSKCGIEHIADYKRSYLSLSRSITLAKLDFDINEIILKREDVIGRSHFWGRYGGTYPIYTANLTTAHGLNYTAGTFYINFKEKLLYANVNLTEDGTQSLHTYGVIPDARSARFEIWQDYEDKRLTDLSYHLQLNHSRLIMSKLKWRPELIVDVQNGIRSKILQLYNETLDSINNTRQHVRSETMEALEGIWQDSKTILSPYLNDLRNLTVIEEDFEYLKSFLNQSYQNNEFYIKDISSVIITLFNDLSIKSQLQSLPKIVQELWTAMGASGKNIKESINFVIEKIKLYYTNTIEFIHDLINGDPIEHLSDMLEKIVGKYDDYIKNIHVSTFHYIENLLAETYYMIKDTYYQFLAALEPTFLQFIHYAETLIWTTGKEFLDFLYIRKNKLIESAYFMEFTKFSRDVDRFYKDITGNNTVEAIYKYGNIGWHFVNEKYINHAPFGKELKAVVLEIIVELEQLGDVPSIKYALNKCNEMFQIFKYYYKYFEIEYKVHRITKFIYRKLCEMSVTALEFENRELEAKTEFIYEPNDGIMFLQQKLPMSWHGFNETPEFQEIPEIKIFYSIYNYLVSSEITFSNFIYDYMPYTDPAEWLPPFKGHAMIFGGKHYVTFDKKYFDFQGNTNCTYLLTTDIINRNFTLLVSYHENGISNEIIIVLNKNNIISLDLFNDRVTINGSETVLLPLEIGNNHLYRETDIITLRSDSGFQLECNIKFQICIFEIAGWHYGKTAGLWGSYNNEPFDDLKTPNKLTVPLDKITEFGNSWMVNNKHDEYKTKSNNNSSIINNNNNVNYSNDDESPLKNIQTLCHEFFQSKVSDLSTCFSKVPKHNFMEMCLNSSTTLEACRSAVGYIETCHKQNTPLNIPDSCIKCSLPNGTVVGEGEFLRLYGNSVPRNADIVFIVEAKKCNKNLRNTKNFDILIESINQELFQLNITNNRYAVVVFGGDGVFNAPRSMVLNSKTFTDSNSILDYFNIPVLGNGTSDIYQAIIFATKLMFRAAVSRNIILLPCSQCDEDYMEHDYSTVHQILFESSITLHILMDNTFSTSSSSSTDWKKDSRIAFGIDSYKAYTKKDIKKLDGDQLLRNSINFSKSGLGLCFSLALETNGTVFSAKYLETEKNAKKFSPVFAKRFAYSAIPKDCTDCECTSHYNGLSFMECTPCTYPRSNMEHHSYYEDDEIV